MPSSRKPAVWFRYAAAVRQVVRLLTSSYPATSSHRGWPEAPLINTNGAPPANRGRRNALSTFSPPADAAILSKITNSAVAGATDSTGSASLFASLPVVLLQQPLNESQEYRNRNGFANLLKTTPLFRLKGEKQDSKGAMCLGVPGGQIHLALEVLGKRNRSLRVYSEGTCKLRT